MLRKQDDVVIKCLDSEYDHASTFRVWRMYKVPPTKENNERSYNASAEVFPPTEKQNWIWLNVAPLINMNII